MRSFFTVLPVTHLTASKHWRFTACSHHSAEICYAHRHFDGLLDCLAVWVRGCTVILICNNWAYWLYLYKILHSLHTTHYPVSAHMLSQFCPSVCPSINDLYEVAHALSIGAKINDLGWHWTAETHSVPEKMRLSEPNTKKWMKIDPYYQRQKCSALSLVSRNIKFVRIFAGVL